MRRLDKLIKKAGAIAPEEVLEGVHIIEGEYCFTCNGSCVLMHKPNPSYVVISTDISHEDIVVVSSLDGHNGYNDAPTDILVRIIESTGESQWEK